MTQIQTKAHITPAPQSTASSSKPPAAAQPTSKSQARPACERTLLSSPADRNPHTQEAAQCSLSPANPSQLMASGWSIP